MYASGATICVSGLERTWCTLRALAESARNELGLTGEVEIKAYLSPEGAGFAQHYDPRTVTTVQISGSKEWRFGRSVTEQFPLGNSPFPLTDDQQQHLEQGGVETVSLRPGDLLCLPPGTIHWAAASDYSLALNCSFEYIGDTVAELVAEYLLRELQATPQLRQTFFRDVVQSPAVREHNSRCIKAILNEMPDAISRSLDKIRDMYG
ncbi:JmjC domain-containing protein [Roseibium sp. FZY0029]|uniref:JmjC domain-containing protein n=1 Tax=Roseibium sp. FZY0029 TaxID=3116647 RepID=UPI003FA71D05